MPKKPKLDPRDVVFRRSLFISVLVIALVGIFQQIGTTHTAAKAEGENRPILANIYRHFNALTPKIRNFQDDQVKSGIIVADNQTIQNEITPFYFYAEQDDIVHARNALINLQADYLRWRGEYDKRVKQKAESATVATPPAAVPNVSNSLAVPILIYHKTPGDFDQQLSYLQAHGYTSITPTQLVSSLHHASSIPPKSVIITFDDGFSDQLVAFELLKKHGMKATYYIINGGPASNWCIGANRHSGDCGDGYLNWDEIRMLDRSGLITIAGHTIDHSNLPTLPADQQRHEIVDSKIEIEQQIGHQITDFAFPYGSFNATTIQIVREAGYQSAVSTIPGTIQSLNNLYALYRVRDAFKLP